MDAYLWKALNPARVSFFSLRFIILFMLESYFTFSARFVGVTIILINLYVPVNK